MARLKELKTDVNYVFLRGKIAGIYSNPKKTYVFLNVKDLTRRPTAEGMFVINNIKVTFFGQQGRNIAAEYKRGDRVEVKGSMQSVHDLKHDTWSLECWGNAIQKGGSVLEQVTGGLLAGDQWLPDENIVILRGLCTSAYEHTEHIMTFNIRTAVKVEGSNRPQISNTPVNCYVKDAKATTALVTRGGNREIVSVCKVETVSADKSRSGVAKTVVRPVELRILTLEERKELEICKPVDFTVLAKPAEAEDPVDTGKIFEELFSADDIPAPEAEGAEDSE